MKKLLILLAALSLVACSSNKPMDETVETTPMATEVMEDAAMTEDKVMEEVTMMEDEVVEEAAMMEDKVMDDAAMMEDKVMDDAAMMEDKVMEEAPMTYTVMEGDNLFEIGLKYDMSWDKLIEGNNISNPDVLTPGQVIEIPMK